MRKSLELIDKAISWRKSKIAEHTGEIEKLRVQRSSYYTDSGLLPFALMPPEEQAKIRKMPIGEPCEYCQSVGDVRIGKDRTICFACGHVQSKKPKA